MKCEICNKEFKSIYSLTGHLQQVHHIKSQEYYDEYLKQETDGICATCGKSTNFISITSGYRKFCCKSCSMKCPETQKKRINTNIDRFGVSDVRNLDKYVKKRKNTTKEKYGSETPLGNIDIQNNIKQHNLDKFGVEYPLQNKEIYEQTKKSLELNYKVDNPGKSEELIKKRLETLDTNRNQFIKDYNLYKVSDVILEYGQGWFKARDKLGINIIYNFGISFITKENKEKAKEYYEKLRNGHRSWLEKEIHDYLLLNYNGKIIINSKSIIPNQELDFYLPDINFAIEFNGNYYHSIENDTPIMYHFNKSKLCEERNIKLLHIYEYEWLTYPEKIKNLINKYLGNHIKIDHSECIIKQISNEEAKILNNKINIYGHRDAEITYGLFYNNSLVQLLSFNKVNKNDWNIVCNCKESNMNVIGGTNKLLKYFIYNFNPNIIRVNCDFNKFNGTSYKEFGMICIKYTNPNKITLSKNTIYGSGSKIYEWRCTY